MHQNLISNFIWTKKEVDHNIEKHLPISFLFTLGDEIKILINLRWPVSSRLSRQRALEDSE